jgi:Mg-chelatase subunit ChlD
LLLLTLFTWPAHSQESPCQIRKLPVSFRDAQNLPIQSISVADLEANVHGKPVKFLSLVPDLRPHRLVLLLDTSGSMGSIAGEAPPWRLELSLARHFVAVNQQKSQIALLLFNDQVNDVIDFSQGNSAVADMLQQIDKDPSYVKKFAKGRTALRDAILQAVQLLGYPSSADALYILTDGGDNASTHSTVDVNQRLAVTSVRLFAVVIQDQQFPHGRAPEELSGPGELSEIARKSGGDILSAAPVA